MKPGDYYMRLVASISEADVRLVAACMTESVGMENSVRLDDLSRRVGMNERKVREILSKLTIEYGWPIGAISGRAGRWIIVNEADRDMVLADLGSRVSETQARIRALRAAKLAPEAPREVEAVQPALLDVPEPDPVPYWRW